VLSRLFRRLFLDTLRQAHTAGKLVFFHDLAGLGDRGAFAAHIAPLRRAEWVVYAKRPLGGPAAVLAYLARYTHRVAIANRRLITLDEKGVSFRWKDYRARSTASGDAWIKTMTLPADEFIRRFLIHVLPDGFHRIRHYGLFASGRRAATIAHIKGLIGATEHESQGATIIIADRDSADTTGEPTTEACPCCGGRMRIIETFARGATPRTRPTVTIRIDTS
jgi:hypothetical protein